MRQTSEFRAREPNCSSIKLYFFTALFMACFTLIHLLIVISPKHGDAVIVMLLVDLPLVLFVERVLGYSLDAMTPAALSVLFGIGGTCMYAALGAFVGGLIDMIRRKILANRGKTTEGSIR